MHCVFGAVLELAQLVLYDMIGCFASVFGGWRGCSIEVWHGC